MPSDKKYALVVDGDQNHLVWVESLLKAAIFAKGSPDSVINVCVLDDTLPSGLREVKRYTP